MNLVFVTAFGSICTRVLPLLDTLDDDILIVAGDEQIYKFFRTYTDYKVWLPRCNPNLFTRKHPLISLVRNYFLQILDYYELKKQLKGNIKIYFFGSGYKIIFFSWIQKLRGEKYYYPSIHIKGVPIKIETPLTRFACLFIKLILGIDVYTQYETGYPLFELTERFFIKNNIKTIEEDWDEVSLREIAKSLDIIDKKILLLLEDLVTLNRVDEEEITVVFNKLVAYLKDFFGLNHVIVKMHPRLNKQYGMIKHLDKLPDYVPSELLLYNKWDIIIGVESQSLIVFSKQFKGRVVSLIDLFEYRDKSVQQTLREWLKDESKGNIIFLKTLEELRQVRI